MPHPTSTPDATLNASYQADKAFMPHPTSTPDATLNASYQAYARQRNSLI
ncbi:hypothetical protein [Escherichia coli]